MTKEAVTILPFKIDATIVSPGVADKENKWTKKKGFGNRLCHFIRHLHHRFLKSLNLLFIYFFRSFLLRKFTFPCCCRHFHRSVRSLSLLFCLYSRVFRYSILIFLLIVSNKAQ